MIHTVKQNSLFWLTVVFLHVVFAAPAFAQMQDSTIYSDAWADENYVYGSGVTDSPYNSYGHTFRAVTTMTSPQGRVSSSDTGYGSYASAFATLTFIESDTGIYNISTEHFNFCPIAFSEYSVGSTSAAVKLGFTGICYDYYSYDSAQNKCNFQIQYDCPVTRCKSLNLSYSRPRDPSYGVCPQKVYVGFRWHEQQGGCLCVYTCVKTADVAIYDGSPCTCVQVPPD